MKFKYGYGGGEPSIGSMPIKKRTNTIIFNFKADKVNKGGYYKEERVINPIWTLSNYRFLNATVKTGVLTIGLDNNDFQIPITNKFNYSKWHTLGVSFNYRKRKILLSFDGQMYKIEWHKNVKFDESIKNSYYPEIALGFWGSGVPFNGQLYHVKVYDRDLNRLQLKKATKNKAFK